MIYQLCPSSWATGTPHIGFSPIYLLCSQLFSQEAFWLFDTFLPDLFAFPDIVQRKKDVCVLSNGVVGEALQAEEEVMRHWHPTGFPVPLTDRIHLMQTRENHWQFFTNKGHVTNSIILTERLPLLSPASKSLISNVFCLRDRCQIKFSCLFLTRLI